MADDILARAEVIVNANTVPYDKAMEQLPNKAKKQINKAIDTIKEEMGKTKLEMGKLFATGGSIKDITTLNDYYVKLEETLKRIKKGAVDQAAALGTMNKALKDGGTFNSNKLQVFAQTLDDLQYVPEMGLRPILNNLTQISPILGVAGIAIQALINNWDSLSAAFGRSSTKTQAEQMEELSKKVSKTADETKRLNEYERERSAIKAQESSTTEAQSKQTEAVNKAIAEGPRDKIHGAIKDLNRDAIRNATPQNKIDALAAAKREMEAAENGLEDIPENAMTPADYAIKSFAEGAKARYKKLADEIASDNEKALEEFAKELGGKIATDPKKLAAFVEQAEKSGKFSPEFISKISAASKEANKTPEQREQEDDEAAEAHFQRQQYENAQKQKAWEKSQADLQGSMDQRKIDSMQGDDDAERARLMHEAEKAATNNGKRTMSQMLLDVAKGKPADTDKITAKIADQLRATNNPDADKIAPKATYLLNKQMEDKLAARMAESGESRTKAAQYLFAQDTKAAQDAAQALKPSYGVSDSLSYHQELTESLLKGGSKSPQLQDETKRLADVAQDQTKALKELNDSMRRLGDGIVGRFGGGPAGRPK